MPDPSVSGAGIAVGAVVAVAAGGTGVAVASVVAVAAGSDVVAVGFVRLDESQLYHLWITRGDQVLLVCAFNVNPEGKWAGEFDFTFEEGDRVWMTPEPASGSDRPTGEAVFRTRF